MSVCENKNGTQKNLSFFSALEWKKKAAEKMKMDPVKT